MFGYDSNKMAIVNDGTKFNLRNCYLIIESNRHKINIKSKYIVNIGIDFEIVVKPNSTQMMFFLNVFKS